MDHEKLRELSKAELLRICLEFRSERDAAKRDAMRAFDERDILLSRLDQIERQMKTS